MNKPLVVNLLGGPGCGKSTCAAYVFATLKMADINAELVTEFAKDKTWEHNSTALNCQPYVFGKQVYRLDRCADQVDVIVTDSPIFLSTIYNGDVNIEPEFTQTVMKKFKEFNNINIFLTRLKKYNPAGRSQTESEAKEIDMEVLKSLEKLKIPYQIFPGCKDGYDNIVQLVMEERSK